MKLIAPAGVTSTTHDGVEIHVEDDGTVNVPEHVARVLYSHGFTAPKSPPDVSNAPREELIDHARDEIVSQLNGMSTEDLRRAVASINEGNSEKRQAEITADPDATVADVEKMSRNEMFAYLKAKGVSVSLPIKNEHLREIAVKTAAGV